MNKYTIYVLTYSDLELSVLSVLNSHDLNLMEVVDTILERERKSSDEPVWMDDLEICNTTKSSSMNKFIVEYEPDLVDNGLTLSMIKDDVILTLQVSGDEQDVYFITHVID